jgi:hypothetical protein
MLPGIGRLGAGSCTVLRLSQTDRVHPRTFAATTGFLDPGDLDDFHLRRDHVQQLADILTHYAQITATVGTACTRIKLSSFTQGRIRDAWTTTQCGCIGSLWDRFVLPFIDGRIIVFSHRNQ